MTKLIYQLAKGENPKPQLEYIENQCNRFLFGDIMWFLTTKGNRWKTTPSFFKFFPKDTIYQLLRLKDFGPIIGYLMENLFMFWDKEFRKSRLRINHSKTT